MKSTQVIQYQPPQMNVIFPAAAEKITRARKLKKLVDPPNEETISQLNEKAKQYPFCVHYREKNHDPL